MSNSLGAVYLNVTWALSKHTEALSQLQEKGSTGKQVNRPSDDPAISYRLLEMKSQEKRVDTYKEHIEDTYSFLEMSSSILQNLSEQITDARTMLTSVNSAIHSSDGQAKRSAAEGIDLILEQLLAFANTEHRGQFLFGGANSVDLPYVATREDGRIVRVRYEGSMQERKVQVHDGMVTAMNLVGPDLFNMNTRQDPEFFGTTGAAPGTGTSSVTNTKWLQVRQAGANYELSIDDGLTWTTVAVPPGNANTQVTDSVSGEVLYVDTTGITQEGVEPVRVAGTYDVFNLLVEIRDYLLNTENLDDVSLEHLTQEAIIEFENMHEKIAGNFHTVGGKLGILNALEESLEDHKYDVKEEINRLENADIAQLATDIARRETLYEMSLMMAGRLFSLNIFNYVR